MVLPGDQIFFAAETKSGWWPFKVAEHVPAVEGILRVDPCGGEGYEGKSALVVQVLDGETVHAFDRRVAKYWQPHDADGNEVPYPSPEEEYYPREYWVWCLVLCNDALIYAGQCDESLKPQEVKEREEEQRRKLKEAYEALMADDDD